MIGKLDYKRLLLLAALPAFMLASCSKEETPGEPGSNPDAQSGEIRFEIGFAPQGDPAVILSDSEGSQPKGEAPATRVATDTKFNSTWEDGDEIGIFAVKHGEVLLAASNYIHNVKLTYRNGTWTASEGIYWPKDGTKLYFYAYYPYSDAATAPTAIAFSVSDDQSVTTTGKPAYNRNDLLMAENDNNGAGFGRNDGAVRLYFKHALAMVQVKVSSSMVGSHAPDALNVWLNGCTTGCVLNLSAQSTTLSSSSTTTPQKIKMYPCPNDGSAPGIYAYRALVPVQRIAHGTAMFRFEYGDGNVLLHSKPLTADYSLTMGQAEMFDMTFPSSLATVSSGVRLTDLFTDDELAAITHLKVYGKMTKADFTTIKEKMTGVTHLDLGEATVEGNAIPDNALSDKTIIDKFVFPRNIERIGDHAFQGCNNLTGNLTIPEGVTTIGDHAFDGCNGFTSLTLPQSLSSIGTFAFSDCTSFSSITCHISSPDKATYGDQVFQGIHEHIIVYVPAEAVAAYKSHAVWEKFKDNIQAINP